ncbi:uncharacterized protein LOC126381339 isoform X1 [Pectinophora gossypiella]|uniref:uncharacterized protein LOC126381339 isoform X1 n=1 Tax=Pectinophora gossypiella TaxID=13191 RepID=UPI00214F519D|nr:uncharacterized protein LOC126381339 isoform X1 [Pectinophora gossypiella]
MNSAIGNLPCYEVGSDWRVFKERLKIWLDVNTVKQESKEFSKSEWHRAVLRSALNETAYKLVRELIAPKTVTELSYDEIITAIDKHLLPKKSLFAERHHFHSATQRVGEEYAHWAARVRRLSTDCEFGSVVDEMLRDRFILGMQPGAERNKLFLEEPKALTLNKALDIAVSVHSARQAARQSESAPAASAVGTAQAQLALADVYRVAASSSSGVQCDVCGYKNHNAEKCRFKGYKCKNCGLKGHLKRMCKSDKRVNMLQVQSSDGSNDDDDIGTLNTQRRINHRRSYCLDVIYEQDWMA